MVGGPIAETWVWFVYTNDWWLDSGNLITCSVIYFNGGSNTILELVVESNTTPQNQLVR